MKADIADYNARKPADKEEFKMIVAGKTYEDRKEAGAAIIGLCKEMKQANVSVPIGEYFGMKMSVSFDSFMRKFSLTVKDHLSHTIEVGSDPSGNITRINNALDGMSKQLEEAVTKLQNVEHQLETAKIEVIKPFPQEAELSQKLDRLAELNALLNMDERGDMAETLDEKGDVAETLDERSDYIEDEPTTRDEDTQAAEEGRASDPTAEVLKRAVGAKVISMGERIEGHRISDERTSIRTRLAEKRAEVARRDEKTKEVERPERHHDLAINE